VNFQFPDIYTDKGKISWVIALINKRKTSVTGKIIYSEDEVFRETGTMTIEEVAKVNYY
jgi:hypothetical protein